MGPQEDDEWDHDVLKVTEATVICLAVQEFLG